MNDVYRKYGDMISMSHHVSKRHPQMAMLDRAAQFAPFAALTGHEEAIEETARLTEEMVPLDENGVKQLNEKMAILQSLIKEKPEVTITYFVPDEKKAGGAYEKVSGCVRRVDEIEKMLYLEDGKTLSLLRIFDLEGDIFRSL